ncbi:hypothetical protein HBH85_001570 [Parastagonospora nodorum]|nr:hypothetical protein HBH85_001570 [Parastagonospora nodorum]
MAETLARESRGYDGQESPLGTMYQSRASTAIKKIKNGVAQILRLTRVFFCGTKAYLKRADYNIPSRIIPSRTIWAFEVVKKVGNDWADWATVRFLLSFMNNVIIIIPILHATMSSLNVLYATASTVALPVRQAATRKHRYTRMHTHGAVLLNKV